MADPGWSRHLTSPLDVDLGPFIARSALALGSNLFIFEKVLERHLGILRSDPKSSFFSGLPKRGPERQAM